MLTGGAYKAQTSPGISEKGVGVDFLSLSALGERFEVDNERHDTLMAEINLLPAAGLAKWRREQQA